MFVQEERIVFSHEYYAWEISFSDGHLKVQKYPNQKIATLILPFSHITCISETIKSSEPQIIRIAHFDGYRKYVDNMTGEKLSSI